MSKRASLTRHEHIFIDPQTLRRPKDERRYFILIAMQDRKGHFKRRLYEDPGPFTREDAEAALERYKVSTFIDEDGTRYYPGCKTRSDGTVIPEDYKRMTNP
jgi:hypothetical protein